jgi:hypothetical protein
LDKSLNQSALTPNQAMDALPDPNVERNFRWRAHHGALLLVVVILVLLVVSNSPRIMKPVKKNTSQKVCVEVASAVASYYADYERFPVDELNRDLTLDAAAQSKMLGILAAKGDVKLNPRNINYVEGMQQAKNVGGKVMNGIDFEGDEALPTLMDPWGKHYIVLLDGDYNGEIDNPELLGIGGDKLVPKIRGKKCLVYGAGRDGDYETWADNPKSW